VLTGGADTAPGSVDYLAGSQFGGHDTLLAVGGGDVVMYGGSAKNTMDASGSTGNVWMNDSTGSVGDTMLGGSGNDIFEVRGTGNDTMDGAGGSDLLFLQNYTFANVTGFSDSGGTGSVDIGSQTITFSNMETLEFSDGTKITL